MAAQRDQGMSAPAIPPAILAAALTIADIPLILCDPRGRIALANEAAAKLLGSSSGALRGIPAHDALPAGHWDARTLRAPPPTGAAEGDAAGDTWQLLSTTDGGSAADHDSDGEHDWSTMLALLGRLRPTGSLAQMSQLICEVIRTAAGLDSAAIAVRPTPREVVSRSASSRHVGIAGSWQPFAEPQHLERLWQLAADGPWLLDHRAGRPVPAAEADLASALAAPGVTGSAYVRVAAAGRDLGLLGLASGAMDGPDVLASRLPLIEQMAQTAADVLSPQTDRLTASEARRQAMVQIIDERALRTVFQPVVRLPDGEVCGYEALSRFHDGTPPNEVIAEAHELGLGVALEEACIDVALESAARLPEGPFLSLNIAPETVVAGGIDRMAPSGRSIVVEITEHTDIPSYAEVRRALRRIAPIQVAIDDAGAGFASMRHVLELSPHYLKLDMGLVRNVDSDPARAALVAGMCYFSRTTGTELIAEGVETEAEAEALSKLGVGLAQGYLFGRPEPR